ncbi:MAG: phosphate ABC transporter permease [Cyanophyceae cyanobacterium]
MLIPLTNDAFEQLVPRIATYDQYRHYWGKASDFLRRLAISTVALVVVWVVGLILGEGVSGLTFALGFAAALYWFWVPVFLASRRNGDYRKYRYCGMLSAKVVETFVTEELLNEQETVNPIGDLVIVENRERCINVVVCDEAGFEVTVQAPLRRDHKGVVPGQRAEMVVFSNDADLGRIGVVGDLYVPTRRIWVSDYPCVQRDAFLDIAEQVFPRSRSRSPQRVQRSQRQRSQKSGLRPRSGRSPRSSDRRPPRRRY